MRQKGEIIILTAMFLFTLAGALMFAVDERLRSDDYQICKVDHDSQL